MGEGNSVLEVGAGSGNLTEKLARKVRVAAIEKDRDLYETLKRRIPPSGKVTLIQGDALRVDYPPYNKIVSNIPYSISRELLQRFIVEGFELAVLVVQKEFAHKLIAKPGQDQYRMLSVLAQSTCDIEYLRDIPPQSFNPKPTVSSAAIRLKQTWKPPKEYITFLNRLFSRKNKKIRNILEDFPKEYTDLIPCDMNPTEFRNLYQAINTYLQR